MYNKVVEIWENKKEMGGKCITFTQDTHWNQKSAMTLHLLHYVKKTHKVMLCNEHKVT